MWCPCEVLVVGQQVCCWPHAHDRKHSEARSTSVLGVRMHPERIRSAGPRGAWAQGCCHLLPLAASRLLPSSPAVALPGVCRQAPVRYVGVSAVCRRLTWLAALADGRGRLGPMTGLLCFLSPPVRPVRRHLPGAASRRGFARRPPADQHRHDPEQCREIWRTVTRRRRDDVLRRLVGRLVGGAKEWIVTECMPGALGRVWRSGAALCRSMSTRRSLCRCVSGWGARDLRLQPRYPSFWATSSATCGGFRDDDGCTVFHGRAVSS